MNKNLNDKWINAMKIGASTGCHQRPERSFFYKDFQFPVCARCTGVIIGYIISFIIIPFKRANLKLSVLLCIPMLADWAAQRAEIKESTNIRRLITGFLGGLGIMRLYFTIIHSIYFLIKSKLKH
jgi:uncharacterized membrane protein